MSAVARAVALAALVAAVAACGGESPDPGGPVAGAERFREAAAGLCAAAAAAGEGDLEEARATFYDRAHDALHEIARAAEAADRTTVARLLERKQQVESGLDGAGPAPGLARDLGALAGVTGDVLADLSITVEPCP